MSRLIALAIIDTLPICIFAVQSGDKQRQGVFILLYYGTCCDFTMLYRHSDAVNAKTDLVLSAELE